MRGEDDSGSIATAEQVMHLLAATFILSSLYLSDFTHRLKNYMRYVSICESSILMC